MPETPRYALSDADNPLGYVMQAPMNPQHRLLACSAYLVALNLWGKGLNQTISLGIKALPNVLKPLRSLSGTGNRPTPSFVDDPRSFVNRLMGLLLSSVRGPITYSEARVSSLHSPASSVSPP